ncbi:serine protease inhibitor ecotin [Tamlana agarivorans]|uniref:Serine protease inhibitor ecotin n=1 Tax=Pseudotamlana agarivorans TaxID=481183 RepID=A0ACC5UCS0_9FLAO|nr:serine protease inhibitor ecotin [Tamlana agarivorans]MBU2952095.1 serine protease inhibitor ecotin [Tamlana agarivorans]
MKLNILMLSIILLVCSCKAQNTTNKKEDAMPKSETVTHDISMYPKANNNQLRHIINLPKTEDDFDFKVEIYAGKMAEVDCNQSTLSGSFKAETVSGWGYSYYNFDTNGQIASTRRMCPDNSKHQAFVQTQGEIVRYNSKLPIVVYTPKGYEVRYKIWSRNTSEKTAIIK